MKKAMAALLLSSLALCAADVTGKWSGGLKGKRDDGSEHSDTAYLVLKQEGAAITGSIGGREDDQKPIQNGKIEGGQITLEVPNERGNFKVSLKLQEDGETLKGEIQRQRDGRTQTAQLEVKRIN